MAEIDQTTYSAAATDTSTALTRVMILHPIACGLAFIAFILALGAGVFGSLIASFVSAITFLVTVAAVACDIVLFDIIKNNVNADLSGSHAYYSIAMWTIIAAMILLFFATFIIFFTCCSARMHKNSTAHSKHVDAGEANGTTAARRHFWQRRSGA